MFEISPSPVAAVTVTPQVISVPALVMNIFEPSIDPLAVLEACGRPRRAGVRAGVRLGQPEGGELAPAREVGQPLPLLLLGAELVDRQRPERVVRGDRDRDRRVDPRQLLDRDRIRDGVGARAAVLLGDRHPHQAELAELGSRARTGTASRGRAPPRPAPRCSSANCRTVSRTRSVGILEVEVHPAEIIYRTYGITSARDGHTRDQPALRREPR